MTGATGELPGTDPIAQIAEHLAAIRAVLEAGHEASERARAAAMTAAAASRDARAADTATRTSVASKRIDAHPFVAMPAGTSVRELPDGGRLFVFADGAFVRVSSRGEITHLGDRGEATVVLPARAGQVRLPDGRELTLRPEALRVTHDVTGISGLPSTVQPVLVAEGRYSVVLPDTTRLELSQPDRRLAVITRVGTVLVLGARVDAIGEEVETRHLRAGLRSFATSETGIRGAIESSGTIRVALPGGEDLVVTFPDAPGPGLPTHPGDGLPFCGGGRS